MLKVLVVLTDYSEIAFVVWVKKGGIFSSLFRTQLCHQLRHWIGQESRLSQYKLSKNTYLTVSFREGSGTHSSPLAWKIPWVEEPGGLQSVGSWRVGHDWATSLSLLTFMHWRRKWQRTPVLLPGESQGRGSLVGSRLWGRTESDTTEAT